MICQAPGCEKAVPKGRHHYCSAECAKVQGRIDARDRGRRDRAAAIARTAALRPGRKLRVCLGVNCPRHGKPFKSDGPGNRFCKVCSKRL